MPPLHMPFRRHRSIGEEHLRANRFAEAETAFAQEAADRPDDPRPLLASGHLALMRNDLAGADRLLSGAVARDRKCRQALALLAEVSYRRDDFTTAATRQQAAGNGPVAAKLRSFAGRRPYSLEGPRTVSVPFVRTEPLPILTARVNGGADAHFLLDTGGAELILDASFARAAGIPLFGGQRSYFGGGKAATVAHGAADSLALGDLTVRNLPVQVMALGAIGAALGEPDLAGIVGTCLLYRFLATIDYPGQALILRRKGVPVEPMAGAVEVPMLMADDHIILAEGHLNDGPATTFFVDSGLGGGAFSCPASTLQTAGIERTTQLAAGQGGGGSMRVWPFDVSSLSLGEARREKLQGIAGAFPPQLEWEYQFRIGGLISHGFLDGYAVTFDFERMMMRLAPGPTEPAPR
jgi:hypothetical protein